VFVSEKFTCGQPGCRRGDRVRPSRCGIRREQSRRYTDAFVATVIVVVLLLNTPDAPVPGAVNATFTPETGLLPASFTVTASAFAKAVLIVADCSVVPAFAVIVEGAPAVFVSEKFTVVSPVAAAVTVYGPPVVAFAVNGADATPDAFVATVNRRRAVAEYSGRSRPWRRERYVHPETGLLPGIPHSSLECGGKRRVDRRALRRTGRGRDARGRAGQVREREVAGVTTPATVAVTLVRTTCYAVGGKDGRCLPHPVHSSLRCSLRQQKWPLAPLPGDANVTVTPLTGLLNESLTIACSWAANAVPTVALCAVPAVAVMVVAVPTPPPAARKAAICITHWPEGLTGAVAV